MKEAHMISKECFVSIMQGIEHYCKLLEKLSHDRIIQPESALYEIIDSVVDALSKELEIEPTDTKIKNVWEPILHTYCYSLDFGTDYTGFDWLIKIDGIEYKPTTFEELYDIILLTYHGQT